MTNFTKQYIGKGKQIPNYDIVKITLPIEQVLKFKYEKEGIEYITFEVAKMKMPDNYKRTHTCYVTVPEYASKPSTAKAEEPKQPELPLNITGTTKPTSDKKKTSRKRSTATV